MPVGFRVYTQIQRPDADLIARFAGRASTDLSDAMRSARTMDHAIRAVYTPITPIVGPAVTISVPTGSLSMLKTGLEQTQPGDVVVVNAFGNTNTSLLGANIARGLKHRGVAGFIIDGAIRDVSEMQKDGLPVFARGIGTATGPGGPDTGEVNVPIACGNVVVNPGDIIVADEDGIVVIAPESAEDVLADVTRLEEGFAAIQGALRRGEITRIDEIVAKLRDSGCEFID